MEGYGECWEMTSTYERCGNITAAKDQEQRSFEIAEKERQQEYTRPGAS